MKIGKIDLELSTREPSSSVWKKRQLPVYLPKIEVIPPRTPYMYSSPAPGRPGRAQMLSEAVDAIKSSSAAESATAQK